jgi:hypothetical protein
VTKLAHATCILRKLKMNRPILPKDLQTVIGKEKIDFSVYAERTQPKSFAYGIIGFALFWLFVPSIGIYSMFGPLLRGEDVHFTSNDVPTTANWDNLEPLVIPTLVLTVFLLIGIGFLIWGVKALVKKGGYFIGTETRLIHYLDGTIKYYDWEQFTGNIELNFLKNDLSLEMRRGQMSERDNGPDVFVPETLHLSGIEKLIEVERICRERIKENDPTPAIRQ